MSPVRRNNALNQKINAIINAVIEAIIIDIIIISYYLLGSQMRLRGGLYSDCIEQFTIFFEGDLADTPDFRI